jgi:hypothetical protein
MSRLNWKSIALTYGLAAVTLTVPGVAHATWPAYNIYALTGYGAHPTEALGINSYAEIVGLAQPGNNQLQFTGYFSGPGLLNQFSALPTGMTSIDLTGMNDSLYMVGSAMVGSHPTAVGSEFFGTIQNMTEGIPNMGQSVACGVNHNGDVVGSYTQETSKGVVFHMFRWSSVSTMRTNDTTGYLPGGINENGTVIAANLNPVNTFNQAELDFFPKTGSLTKTLAPGFYKYLYPSGISTYGGITAIGQAALGEENATNNFIYGWAYNQGVNQWETLDAPGNPNYESTPMAVDVWGQKIVGTVTAPGGLVIPTVWEDVNGAWTASWLTDLLPAQPDWVFKSATGINTYGAISGWGLHREGEVWVERAFVMTPQDEFRAILPEGGVFGGFAVFPSIHVVAQNPFAVDFQLSTTTPGVKPPREVVMPGMTTDASFELDTTGVDSDTAANVTVKLGGLQFTTSFTIHPAILTSMTLTSNRDEAGAVGLIGLHGTAGPRGTKITLTSSDPTVTVPANVTVPSGSSSVPFRVTVGPRATVGKVVTITATEGNYVVSQPFTIN